MSYIGAANYYRRLYKRFGLRAVLFLVKSKFKKNKKKNIKIRGIKYPFSLSNFKYDVTTLFQIFFGAEYHIDMKENPKKIIDCGANIGLSAIYFTNQYPDAKIIAIEPDKDNFKFLLLNTKHYPNIICIQKAVWPYAQNLAVVDVGKGNWGVQTKEDTGDSDQIIEGISIDEIMDTYHFETIDLLKIDIEGAERELFTTGYEKWLSKTMAMAIELHDFLDPGISSIFFKAIQPYGFQQFQLGENLILRKS